MPDDPRKPPQKRSQKKFFRQQNTSVIQAPGHKIPACPVPQPCKEPHGHNISDMFQPSGPVSPQGNINVFPEPCAQRYVPPPPKFRNACGSVGIIKIFREAEAKHFSKSYSHIRISAEIKINLKGIGQTAGPRGQYRKLVPRQSADLAEYLPGHICQQHFFCQTCDKNSGAVSEHLPGNFTFLQLPLYLLIPHNRAGDQLGEHGHI